MVVDINSKMIKSVDYFGTTLIILFRNGGMYKYLNVPQEEYDGLMEATSKGTYFKENIKDEYNYTKIK